MFSDWIPFKAPGRTDFPEKTVADVRLRRESGIGAHLPSYVTDGGDSVLMITRNRNETCLYRDALGIQTTDGCVSWYQLLGASQTDSVDVFQHRYRSRCKLATYNFQITRNIEWTTLLEELEQAIRTLSDPVAKRQYDEDLLRRSLQTRHYSLAPSAANEWKQAMQRHVRTASRQDTPITAKSANRETNSRNLRKQFEPLSKLGSGPRGTVVFEAWDFTLNRVVAIRSLQKPMRTADRVAAFLSEARALASISHPNLVQIYSVNEPGCFAVMEYLPTTLCQFVADQPARQCSQDFVIRFLLQTLSILARLHASGVVHGMLSMHSFHLQDGALKLVDAPGTAPDGSFRMPRADQTCVAPEMLAPSTFGEPGAASDLYMIGWTAIELLAGDHLRDWIPSLSAGGEFDQHQYFQWHTSKFESIPDAERLQTLVPQLRPDLNRLLQTFCKKTISDRTLSANDAIRLLRSSNANIDSSVGNHTSDSESAAQSGAYSGSVQSINSGRGILQHISLMTRSRRIRLIGLGVLAGLLFSCVNTEADPAAPLSNLVSHTDADASDSASAESATDPTMNISLTSSVASSDMLDAVSHLQPEIYTESVQPTSLPYAASPDATVSAALEGVDRGVPIPDLSIELASDDRIIPIPFTARHNRELEGEQAINEASLDHELAGTAVVFPVTGIPPAHRDRLTQLLQELRAARPADLERLLAEAESIAPEDPRFPFLRAACHDFRSKSDGDLTKSTQLGLQMGYIAPFRQKQELLLNSPTADLRTANRIMANLISAGRQLGGCKDEAQRESDLRWAGAMLACLCKRFGHNQEFHTYFREARAHIERVVGPTDSPKIAAGFDDFRDSSSEHLHPCPPEIEFVRCLETFEELKTD